MTDPGPKPIKHIASERPEDTAILERDQIGSCGAGETLLVSDAGDRRLPIEILLTDPGGAYSKDHGEQANWNTPRRGPPIQHIVARHHGFLRKELPSIERSIAKAAELRGRTNATTLVSPSGLAGFLSAN